MKYFVGHFALLDQYPDLDFESGSTDLIESGSNSDRPDPKHWLNVQETCWLCQCSGSWSTTSSCGSCYRARSRLTRNITPFTRWVLLLYDQWIFYFFIVSCVIFSEALLWIRNDIFVIRILTPVSATVRPYLRPKWKNYVYVMGLLQ